MAAARLRRLTSDGPGAGDPRAMQMTRDFSSCARSRIGELLAALPRKAAPTTSPLLERAAVSRGRIDLPGSASAAAATAGDARLGVFVEAVARCGRKKKRRAGKDVVRASPGGEDHAWPAPISRGAGPDFDGCREKWPTPRRAQLRGEQGKARHSSKQCDSLPQWARSPRPGSNISYIKR